MSVLAFERCERMCKNGSNDRMHKATELVAAAVFVEKQLGRDVFILRSILRGLLVRLETATDATARSLLSFREPWQMTHTSISSWYAVPRNTAISRAWSRINRELHACVLHRMHFYEKTRKPNQLMPLNSESIRSFSYNRESSRHLVVWAPLGLPPERATETE